MNPTPCRRKLVLLTNQGIFKLTVFLGEKLLEWLLLAFGSAMCIGNLTALLNVEEIPRRQILDRSGQFEKSGENLNICNDHYTALITNFQKHKTCLAENHDETKSRRLEGNDSANANGVKKEFSQHLLKSSGFLLPVGSHICAKCRYVYNFKSIVLSSYIQSINRNCATHFIFLETCLNVILSQHTF